MKNWTNDSLTTTFLLLLRAGLWGEKAVLPRPLSVSEWNSIWRLAQIQCMIGIVFDGIETLPEDQYPPQELLLRWILFVVQIEKQNLIVNTKADEIYTKLREVDINTVLMKGQGIAQEYIRPDHRQSGDIDLFICDDQINKAKAEIVKMNPEKMQEGMKHFSFDSDGIHIELHKSTIGPQIFLSRNKLRKWLDNIKYVT